MSAPAQERQEADGAAQQPAASLLEPDPSDPDPEIGMEADGAAGAGATDAPSPAPVIPEGAEGGTDTAAEVAPETTLAPFVALPSISLRSGSGIPSLELCDVITTNTGRAERTETRRQVEVQPAISYEMVVDIQVARHLQTVRRRRVARAQPPHSVMPMSIWIKLVLP
ncbi:uncharacterized protein LOC113214194 [Frankliniella occidentalis]|uniref:Uncharacterized protein LOC113214194 n=1 Tax=Frankliniella occidentalis TaxID=133901 RepID=A0A9C6XTE2_FRAOC|nr:uncharacterized protein LOC113214194 [Frankliniella occidentalis]